MNYKNRFTPHQILQRFVADDEDPVWRSPRDFRRRPSEAATMPLPSADTTPPVTKTYFV